MSPERSADAALNQRIAEQLAEAGLQISVEASDGTLLLSGIVQSEESRQAAEDIVSHVVPEARIDNQIDVESILPTDAEPDFTDQPGLFDPIDAAGASSDESEDIAQSGDVYSPPTDPVVTTDAHGAARVLGGFGSEDDTEIAAEPSASDGAPGDEALADAVRQELAEDAATTDLNIVVAVRQGVVHLRGRVSDLDDVDNAESVAGRVAGIRDVVEELEVETV